ncbi:DUF2750 domain-containing protein [Alkanindiges sp. WGS2144]|uniref:DUF2750 domain-containing protein n=1 Tax=Alkanindiges sp. WGS2144 TaxID=3366808 RepID=UPI0037508948
MQKSALPRAPDVLEMDARARYKFFIQKIVAERQVWGLYLDGWAVSGTVDGKMALPMWPEAKYARLCRNNMWTRHEVTAMPLKTLVEELIPLMIEQQCLASVFLTPDWKSILISPERLLADIKSYLYACFEQVRAEQALPGQTSTLS